MQDRDAGSVWPALASSFLLVGRPCPTFKVDCNAATKTYFQAFDRTEGLSESTLLRRMDVCAFRSVDPSFQ